MNFRWPGSGRDGDPRLLKAQPPCGVKPFRGPERSWQLFLHRTGHGGDVVLDEEGVEHDQWQRSDQRACHQRSPTIDVAIDELVHDRDRNGLVLGRGDEGECVDELVPAQREAEDESRDQPGHCERQHDPGEDLPATRAVDQGAFLQLEGDGLEIAHQQPGRERDQDGGIGENERERCVEKPVLEDHGRERDEQDRGRHQVGEKYRAADPLRAAIAQPHDSVSGEHARRQRQDRRCHRHQHRIPQPERIVRLEQEPVDVLEGRRPGPERIVAVEVEQLLVRFDGGERHPIEREQQHDQDHTERQIERDQPARQRLEIAHTFGMIGDRDAGQHRFGADDLRHQCFSHWLPRAAICGTERGACPVRGKTKSSGGLC